MTQPLPVPDNEFGARVRRRLENERVIWFTTVGNDGTPQPNPVWFHWDGGNSLLVYNRPDAARLPHVKVRPRLAMHFDGDGKGGDIVVFTGSARVADAPPPHENPGYVEKYRDAMLRVSGTLDDFAVQYPVPVLMIIDRVRGY